MGSKDNFSSSKVDVGTLPASFEKPPYTILEEPLGYAREIRIVTIGAGASGLNVARNVTKHLKNVSLQIYEKNDDVGGTWLENRYPGCACDIPSHNYQYSWEPNPNWTSYYSPQPEILEYFRGAARKHDLLKFVEFKTKVVDARWDESAGVWRFKIERLETGEIFQDYAHFFINASGYLNNWKWPKIPGLDTFAGDLLHSAAWKPETDLAGKAVAVIGYGSSGIQIVTAIQPQVKSLTTFIRGPTWITAGFGSKYAAPGGQNFNFTAEERNKFSTDADEYLAYRKGVEHELSCRFKMLHKDTPEQAAAVEFSTADMIRRLGEGNPLIDVIIPDFAVGCRRPSPGNGYLEALKEPNVNVITRKEIARVEPRGLVLETGELVEVDVIICATGFDLSYRPRFPIVGTNDKNLQDMWDGRPAAYLSLAAADMPNYFMFLGPNAPVGHGSAIPIIEHLTKYMLKMIHKAQTQRYRSFTPSERAIAEFLEHADAFLPRMAWASKCRSWFKNGHETGPVGLYPGSRLHWFHMLKEVRYEDWMWDTLEPNRWAFAGNGFSVMEEEGRDLTWYFDAPEKEYEELIY
ncbi:putative MoxY [Xylariales sp. PMI_506]|nr:putative MoxY [Xylariales sp. PMI_506]